MMRKNNQTPHDSKSKVELANRIADQSKKVSSAYTNMEEAVFRGIRFISSFVDKIVFSKHLMPFAALVLAVMLYLSVNINSDNSIFITPLASARTLNDVTVVARYNSESFEVSGLPETCTVTLTGEAANVTNAAAKSGTCQVNLEGLTEGTHSVNVVAVGYGDNVTATVTPSNVVVTLARKTTAQFEVDYDYVNTDKMDSRYIVGVPEFVDGNRVNIRASQTTLDSIAFVKVLIDVSGKTADFETEAPLVAYDAKGNVVNADIIPNTITVKVPVSSPHKVVPIVLKVSGEVPNNLAIESISMDQQTTIIYASEDVLSSVEQVEINVDASTLTRDTQVAMPVTLPEGVSSADVTMVNLNITLAEAVTKTIEDVPINYQNNDNNYAAVIKDNQTKVSVEVKGTNSNIESITAADLFVYIDLKGLKPGEYDIPLQIQSNTANNFVTYTLVQPTLHITLVGNENSGGDLVE